MAKWFKKKAKINVMEMQGIVATASRALYQDRRTMPKIELRFKVEDGYDEKGAQRFDEVVIEMEALDANDFARDLLAALQVAIPTVAKGARQTQFGE